jgi:tetratricopeptide (TPR) repeat protein
MLGYPDQAIRLRDAMESHARKLGRPYDLGAALVHAAVICDYVREPEEMRRRIEEAERLGRENSLPSLWRELVPRYAGLALIRQGRVTNAIALLTADAETRKTGGGEMGQPFFKSVLAEAIAQIGDVDGALRLTDEAIEQVERPGWEERHYYAEILRIKGWLLSLKGDREGAECAYRASLDWARQQRAKSWELRTAMSYARLMREQGQTKEAYDLLAPVYDWFTEGFDTKDLQEAKSLLAELR